MFMFGQKLFDARQLPGPNAGCLEVLLWSLGYEPSASAIQAASSDDMCALDDSKVQWGAANQKSATGSRCTGTDHEIIHRLFRCLSFS